MNSQLLADALGRDPLFRVTEVEPSETAILSAAANESPDLVLLSAILDDSPTQGSQVARRLRAAHPKIRIVMLLDASEPAAVVDAFRAGARGVFCRTEPLENLTKCIRSAYAGQVWANSRELGYLVEALGEAMPIRNWVETSESPPLSKREHDVVRCVADGLSNREIARQLKLTEHTVKNYLFRVFNKLGVSSRVELVLYAFRLAQAPSSPGRELPGPEAQTRTGGAVMQTKNAGKLSTGRSRRRGPSESG